MKSETLFGRLARVTGQTAPRLLGSIALVFLPACPSKSQKVPRCEKFGQSCQYAPGKLGSCVYKTDCTRPDCLVCQSQH